MKKIKNVIAIVFVVSMMFVFAACGSGSVIEQAVEEVKLSTARMIEGNVKGEVGKTYATQWFEFTIDSIKKIDSIEGYSPEEGNILVDVVATLKGTFEEPSIMGTSDFYMDSDTFADYVWALSPLNESMMPDEYYLDTDETVTYHMIFEVPDGLSDLKIMYTEIDIDNTIYATFVIDINEVF